MPFGGRHDGRPHANYKVQRMARSLNLSNELFHCSQTDQGTGMWSNRAMQGVGSVCFVESV
jgi:hypothetical protein